MPEALSERLKRCLAEIEQIVLQGVEHPRFEFKRPAAIAKGQLDERLDFVKLVQGVSNADIHEERYIVIGGDPKETRFYAVSNVVDFDPARVTQVLDKYLNPLPMLEVFNNVTTREGIPIVVLIFARDQPRPLLPKPRASDRMASRGCRLATSG